jgi:hypothetical protein
MGIGERAFMNCTNLSSVTLPSQIRVVGDGAFSGCSSLFSVQSTSANPPMSGPNMFSQSTLGHTLYVPEEAESAYRADEHWNGFKAIVGTYLLQVPKPGLMSYMLTDSLWATVNNLTISGELNARDMSFLVRQIKKGNHLRVLDMRKVTGISDFSLNVASGKAGVSVLSVVYLPESVVNLSDHAFDGYVNLTEVDMPNGVLSVGNYAFRHCSSLSVADLPFGLRKLGNYAFYGCRKLKNFSYSGHNYKLLGNLFCSSDGKSIIAYPVGNDEADLVLPDSILSIETGAFASSANLSAVTLPQALKSIGDSAFADCQSLSAINIPGSVTYFGMGAFIQDSSLMTLHIAEGVKYIGNSAFQNCSALNSITMAGSVESIGDYAFWNCQRIENFISYASYPPKCKANAFVRRFESPYGHLFTLSEAVPRYQGAPWSIFTVEAMANGE